MPTFGALQDFVSCDEASGFSRDIQVKNNLKETSSFCEGDTSNSTIPVGQGAFESWHFM